jgi:hypothetical protein
MDDDSKQTTKQNAPKTEPRPASSARTAPEGGNGDGAKQVEDTGSTAVPAEEVANAAAKSLHGRNAVEEKYAQPDARALVGGATLIADPEGENPRAGERR